MPRSLRSLHVDPSDSPRSIAPPPNRVKTGVVPISILPGVAHHSRHVSRANCPLALSNVQHPIPFILAKRLLRNNGGPLTKFTDFDTDRICPRNPPSSQRLPNRSSRVHRGTRFTLGIIFHDAK